MGIDEQTMGSMHKVSLFKNEFISYLYLNLIHKYTLKSKNTDLFKYINV